VQLAPGRTAVNLKETWKFFKPLPWFKPQLKVGGIYTGTDHRFGQTFKIDGTVYWDWPSWVKYQVSNGKRLDYCGDEGGMVNEWGFRLIRTRAELIKYVSRTMYENAVKRTLYKIADVLGVSL
jgi:hypothetical protein